ncbi:MAG: PilW family protein [Kofleriaceae bacterium]
MKGASSQRGFTLIELMISLVISTLVVILILSIFNRMSFAYREQQQIVNVQKVLAAARSTFDHDAKQAGLKMSQGFTLAADFNAGSNVRRPPVRVVNNTTTPDEVGFYYADLDYQALVVGPAWTPAAPAPTRLQVTIDRNPGFVANDLVVMSTPTEVASIIDATNDAKVIEYAACVLQIDTVAGTVITFKQNGSYGRAGNDHCQSPPVQSSTYLYKFVARYWRIDRTTTARQAMGALQLDTTGALLGVVNTNFQDQAYGVVDLQVSTYYYDGNATDTADPDSDGNRDWYSSEQQETNTNNLAVASSFLQPLVMSFSLVARTNATVEGIYTANSPTLTVASNTNNNTVGDRASVSLPSTTDSALMGLRIYRYITFQVDLRNTGVGR